MNDEMSGAAQSGGPAGGELTSIQQLVALDAYTKALGPHVTALRAQVLAEMEAADDERKGAKMPDGTKIGAVSYRKGSVTASLSDPAAALAWCLKEHPDEIMQAIRPAFVTHLLDIAKKEGFGFDPTTGQILPFIAVSKGNPGVTVTTTPEGKAFAASLVSGTARMIEGARDGQ